MSYRRGVFSRSSSASKASLPTPPEHAEQVCLFQWAEIAGRAAMPELRLLFAIPNGGDRHPAVAGKLRAEGVRRGVPDTFLPLPAGPYHGLFIELKRVKRSRTSPEQIAWIEALRLAGYRAEVCAGWDAARRLIEDHVRLHRQTSQPL